MPTTKITRGGSFLRAVKYDLEKGTNREDQAKIKNLSVTKTEGSVEGFGEGQRARLLATNVIGDSPLDIAKEFEKVARQRPGIKEPVHKVAISLKPGEHLETHQWLEVGHSYLKAMGYADSPFLIAQHREKDHEHIHIVTSRVDFNGRVVFDWLEKKNAQKWAREIEERYNLTRTPEQSEEKGLTRVEIEQALKTQKTPPKLILQKSIKRTLEASQETPDFLDALREQNISIRVKTNEKKEVVGISYGFDGRAFKASKLGTKFTWKGLIENGLKYEFERDYSRLEETSRRGSRTESASARSKLVAERESEHTRITDAGKINDGLAGRITESNRLSSAKSRRGEEPSDSIARIEFGVESGRDESAVESTSSDAGTEKRFVEEGNGPLAGRHEGELRRLRQFDSAEAETARTTEPEDYETTAAEDEFFPIKRQPIDWAAIDKNEYLRQLEEQQREWKLLNQPPVNDLYPARANDPAGSDLSQPNFAEDSPGLSGTGTSTTALDGVDGIGDADTALHSLADYSNTQRNLGNNPTNNLVGDGLPASSRISTLPGFVDRRGVASDVGSELPDRDDLSSAEPVSVKDLSSELRLSLDSAQSTVRETLELEKRTKTEEIKKADLEELDDDFEIMQSRGRSM